MAGWSTAADAASGPAVARLFHRLLAASFLVAWLSLGAQVTTLIGHDGLLPLEPFLASARTSGWPTAAQLPTLLWLAAGDTALRAGIWVGAAIAVVALFGRAPRLCCALSTILYLSYASAGRSFLSFQWDNLLLECGLLATFLPTDRPARWAHVLFRLLLFKLYWESGIAKWQSHLGDWQDGGAMTFYYETAPLPTALAWYAHALPVWWHHFESYAVLFIELVLPFAIFGPRTGRRAAFVAFTGFQFLNAATANYGFFCYLSAALHVFLLTDGDLPQRRPRLEMSQQARARTGGIAALRGTGAAIAFALFVGISLTDGLLAFAPPGAWRDRIEPLQSLYGPWRVINTYHLFGHITRERVEPEFQTSDGALWTAHDLRYKPGDPLRAPPFVAPHQPRVDFQLWFYGLSFERGLPPYVGALLEQLCAKPAAVQELFVAALPQRPAAVRMVFWRYRFTTPDERRQSGAWWTREQIAATRAVACESLSPSH